MKSTIVTMKVLCIVTVCSMIQLPYLYAASSLDNDGGTVATGSLQVCPDTTVRLTCSHDSVGDLTRWEIGPTIDCTAIVAHTTNPGDATCASFTVNMVSDSSQPTRVSTLVLPLEQSLNGAVVTCYAGGTRSNPQVGNLTIQFISPPSTPTVVSTEYSVVDGSTGHVTFLVSSSGAFGTGVRFYGSVIGDGSVEVAGDRLTVTGLSYTESHTVSVVATSAVCPGILNGSSINVPEIFNTKTLELTQPTGFVDCSNPSLPISGSWSVMEGVQSSFDPTVQLTPPPIGTPTITFTSSPGNLSGNAVFVPDSSYQLTDTVENDVYTFTVTVTNVAGSSSEVSAVVEVTPFVIDESTLGTMNCLTFSLGQNCTSEQNGNFAILLQQVSGVCQNVRPSDLNASTVQLTSWSTCAPVVSSTNLCYRATLTYNGLIIDTQTNLDFAGCPVSVLDSFLADGVSYQLDGEATSGNVSHLTTVILSCTETFSSLSGAAVVTCVDSQWNNTGIRWCSRSCAVPIVLTFVLTLFVGVFVIGVINLAKVYTCRRSKKITLRTETEMIPSPPVIYEEPEDIKPNPHTQENPAYGHVKLQFS